MLHCADNPEVKIFRKIIPLPSYNDHGPSANACLRPRKPSFFQRSITACPGRMMWDWKCVLMFMHLKPSRETSEGTKVPSEARMCTLCFSHLSGSGRHHRRSSLRSVARPGGPCSFFSSSLPLVTPQSSLSMSSLLYSFPMLWPLWAHTS